LSSREQKNATTKLNFNQ